MTLPPTRTILLIAPSSSLLAKAKALGLRTLVVHSPAYVTGAHERESDRLLLADYADWQTLKPHLGRFIGGEEVHGVFSNLKTALLTAGRIAAKLGLVGLPAEVHERTRGKLAMRRHLDEQGYSQIRWASAEGPDQLAAAIDAVGLPCILKPTSGAASLGIHKLDAGHSLDRIWDTAVAERRRQDRPFSDVLKIAGWMVEEYVDGLRCGTGLVRYLVCDRAIWEPRRSCPCGAEVGVFTLLGRAEGTALVMGFVVSTAMVQAALRDAAVPPDVAYQLQVRWSGTAYALRLALSGPQGWAPDAAAIVAGMRRRSSLRQAMDEPRCTGLTVQAVPRAAFERTARGKLPELIHVNNAGQGGGADGQSG
jgi:hypothetical protein